VAEQRAEKGVAEKAAPNKRNMEIMSPRGPIKSRGEKRKPWRKIRQQKGRNESGRFGLNATRGRTDRTEPAKE